MRPVNKGSSPYTAIGSYDDALPYLEEKIGLYCSYCEYPIFHMPEIEHISAKSTGGSFTDWDNLLLACKYCNSRKGKKVTPENINEYLWPDKDNTALAYSYEGGIPSINQTSLEKVDPTGIALTKAQNLFHLIQLDHIPSPKEKDRRFRQRIRAYQLAIDALADWTRLKELHPDGIEIFSRQIIQSALGIGFFSVWMTVFSNEPEVLNALIHAFPGTNLSCFSDIVCHEDKQDT